MEKKILLIGEKESSFIINAIQSALENGGYQVTYVEPEINQIDNADKSLETVILYAGNFIKDNAEVLFYLKDVCVEDEKTLYLVGYKDEIELMMEQQKAMQIQSMEQEMAILKESGSLVPTYNNIKSTIRELNDIFDGAQEYHFEFGKAVRDGDAVRRDISITFSASSYARAEAIIQKLHDCKYRCLIRTLSISSGNESGGVSASLQVTFYETMYEASSTLGLEEAKNEAQTPEDLT